MKTKKTCPNCNKEYQALRRQSWCNPCANEAAREKRKKFPDAQRNSRLKYLFGITVADYNVMHEAQGGVCAICGKPESWKLKGKPQRLAVDHDHETGKVRALLCRVCNVTLGSVEEDTNRLSKMIEYLEKYK